MKKYDLSKLALGYEAKRAIPLQVENEIVRFVKKWLRFRDGKYWDLGCGSGRIMVPLAKRLSMSRWVGVDVSPEMVSKCQEKIEEEGLSKRVMIKCLSMEDPGVFEGSSLIDGMLLYHSFHMVKNRVELVKAIYDKLRNGGRVVVANTTHSQLATTLNYKWLPEVLEWEYLRTPDGPDVIKVFRENGFDLKAVKEICIKKSFRSISEWIVWLSGRPISALTFWSDSELREKLDELKQKVILEMGDPELEYAYDFHTLYVFEKV